MKNRKDLKKLDHSLIKALFAFLFLLTIGFHTSAQSSAGVKFGLSTPDISPQKFLVMDQGVPYYLISVEHTNYGIHAGIFLQVQMGHFFMQPELLFNSSSIEYGLDSLYAPDAGKVHFTGTYRNLDLPFILGFKAGVFRIGAGPVGHMFVSGESGFKDYEGYYPDNDKNKFSWGWQGGIGFDFWKLHFDLRYESNYSTVGDYITFFGKPYDFATDNKRFIGSVGLSF